MKDLSLYLNLNSELTKQSYNKFCEFFLTRKVTKMG